MATRVYENQQSNASNSGVFSRSIVLNWELIAYLAIFFLAIFSRFYMLGDRTMSHDESLHTVFSADLAENGNYQHNPMMHGPILFHATALSYSLFGVDDFSSRIYVAVLGVMVVMSPILLRRWLGRTGAVLTAAMLLASPLLLYYSRYIRHDMPSIISAILMFWAAMMYISGPQQVRRKGYWLYILAASMLWNLGSKETSFIYIAIFGLFLTLYWLVRVVQHYFKIDGRLIFYTLIMAFLFAGVVSLAMIVVISISLQQYPDLTSRLDFLGAQFNVMFSGDEPDVAFSTFLAWTGLTVVFILSVIVSTALWAYRKGRLHFNILDVLVGLLAVLLAVYITDLWSHTTFTRVIGETSEIVQQSTSAASLGVGLAAAGSLLLVYAAFRVLTGRLFTTHFVVMVGLVFAVFSVLIIVEELSHEPSRAGEEQPLSQPVPDESDPLGLDSSQPVQPATTFNQYPLVLIWSIAAVSIALIVYSKAKGWWREVRHFPEFDVLLVMGSLILPWLTAVFIYMSESTPADWDTIGASLTWLSSRLPVNDIRSVGQFVIGFLAFLPMMLISIAAGLAWNWKRWLIAAGVFHLLFALFFTTVFTNIEGLASGMVYSLQYWLEQQGVRRGSQPQYYYTNVIMPMYEFLPIVGSMLAMIAGSVFFWRKRRQKDDEAYPVGETAGTYGMVYGRTVEPTDEIPVETEPVTAMIDEPVVDTVAAIDEDEGDSFEADVVAVDPDEDLDLTTNEPLPGGLWQGLVLAFFVIFGMALTLHNGLLRPHNLVEDVNVLGFLADLPSIGDRLQVDLMMPSGALVVFGAALLIVSIGFLIFVYLPIVERHWQERYVRDPDLLLDDPFEDIPQEEDERQGWGLNYVPFLLFVAFWAVMNLYGYTLAGEKMPWLGTHLTVPMILLSGWYFGRVLDRIEWSRFANNGWVLLFVLPIGIVAFAQVVLPIFGGQPPFQGTSSVELRHTYQWLGAAVVFSGVLAGVYWLATQFTGWSHVRQMFVLAGFAVLLFLTFRAAWMANYINHDLATEFLVYAHGGPANKEVTNFITEMSQRTTGGYNMLVMHDNKFSWPGSWYLREFQDTNSVRYIDANTPTQQQIDEVQVVLVGPEGLSRLEPLVADTFQRFDSIRMWWPMQDYFNVTATDVNNFLDFSATNENLKRRGIFDIWWNRDYRRYERARINETPDGALSLPDYSEEGWPVSDPLYFFVRKDLVAQIWPYGIGDAQVLNTFTEVSPNVCVENFVDLSVEQIYTDPLNPLARPMGLEVNDGRLYVANDGDSASRINVFALDGRPLDPLGVPGTSTQLGAFFTRPNSVDIGADGNVYVVDTWNFQVRVFDEDYEFLTLWGQPETSGFEAQREPVDGFWGPRDIAVDAEGRVYVSDTGNKRVRVYDPQGNFLFDIASGGAGEGNLNEPSGIDIHSDGRLFVADTWNQRIAVFDSRTGVFIANYRVRAWFDGTGGRPYLALDEDRNLIYLTDPDAGRILVLDTNGNCIGSFGSVNEGPANETQFGDIGGIAVDADGAVYVSDLANNRVMKFPRFPLPSDFAQPETANDDVSVPFNVPESTEEVLPEVEATEEMMPAPEETDEVESAE